ncbi:MAG: NTP transferase domain-containing protein, partial [Actinobacteria bacterium]|nr:NTP transferase domain-containing protein [Actinomycetota bacterium]
MSTRGLVCVVLAAGSGTRMVSATPKVMHPLAGRTLLGHVMATASSLETSGVYVVLRHQKELIGEYLTKNFPAAVQVEQDEIPGTGRAVEVSLSKIPADFSGDVLVVSGDVPLMDKQTLNALIETHRSGKASATILTAVREDPTGYGRILRSADGQVAKIVEHLDATEAELAISEINAGVYIFDASNLREALSNLESHNAQGERYL